MVKSNPPITKKCSVCKQEKLSCEFDLEKSEDKHMSTCRECEGEELVLAAAARKSIAMSVY